MLKLLLVLCVAVFHGSTYVDCASNEDWGLLNGGWSWLSWYYYWYWRHGTWGRVSDHDTICQRLWGLDHNRIHQKVDYDIRLQARVSKNSSVDKANYRLFSGLNMATLRKKPTYNSFIDLLNEFQSSTSGSSRRLTTDGTSTTEEKIDKFLVAVLQTRVFQNLYWYLVRNDFVSPDKEQFKKELFHLWFSKGNLTTQNPSVFEKVFVGESVNNPSKLSVRNWIQFYILESRIRRLNYYGYVNYYQYDPKVISVMFSWDRGVPVTDNMLIGTSPEFELALYTLCFFTRPGAECECKVNIKKIVIKTITSGDGKAFVNAHFEIKV